MCVHWAGKRALVASLRCSQALVDAVATKLLGVAPPFVEVVHAARQADHTLLHLLSGMPLGSLIVLFSRDGDTCLSASVVAPQCHLVVRGLTRGWAWGGFCSVILQPCVLALVPPLLSLFGPVPPLLPPVGS